MLQNPLERLRLSCLRGPRRTRGRSSPPRPAKGRSRRSRRTFRRGRSASSSSACAAGRRMWTPSTTSRSSPPTPASPATRPGTKLLGSKWKFAQHGQSGLWISELFPNVAKHADELCLLRSMQTDLPAHPQAFLQMHTGSFQFVRPSLGAWTLYGLGTRKRKPARLRHAHAAGGLRRCAELRLLLSPRDLSRHAHRRRQSPHRQRRNPQPPLAAQHGGAARRTRSGADAQPRDACGATGSIPTSRA